MARYANHRSGTRAKLRRIPLRNAGVINAARMAIAKGIIKERSVGEYAERLLRNELVRLAPAMLRAGLPVPEEIEAELLDRLKMFELLSHEPAAWKHLESVVAFHLMPART